MNQFRLQLDEDVIETLRLLKKRDPRKLKKVEKALCLLQDDPRHPGLHTHRYANFDGDDVWQSYVENRTPGAWRVWWHYGPESDEISVIQLGPHPD
jgi:hypothetical protein